MSKLPTLLGITATSGSKVGETEGAGKALLATIGGLLEAKIEPIVCPLMGKPSVDPHFSRAPPLDRRDSLFYL